ncbi:hypothetical protein NKR23_g8912 [Pleurostoma richardsiae]|uniref:Uncharacterized protein n=1 Tax=Pleurostoma richardsiae TaxID=41990 RepID=A0AA38VNR1_9PEZI|nr:hypothetical protein NKR23_g8912 [Pleurostoma richardsiae]
MKARGLLRGDSWEVKSLLHNFWNLERGFEVSKPFEVEWVEEKDLEAGVLKASWLPPLDPQTVGGLSKEQQEAFTRAVVIGTLLAVAHGAWSTTDEWNRLLPDYRFTGLGEFLEQVWARD